MTGELHLHAAFVEAVGARELQVKVTGLDVPFANIACLVLGVAILIYWIYFSLHHEVHLLDFFSFEFFTRGLFFN